MSLDEEPNKPDGADDVLEPNNPPPEDNIVAKVFRSIIKVGHITEQDQGWNE